MSAESVIALFGGSFNPPHLGHLGVCAHVLDREPGPLWLVPTSVHPFGKELAPFDDRVRMCELLVSELAATGRIEVSRVESDVPAGTGRTVDLLEHLTRRMPGRSFRLVLGSDLLEERQRWKDFDRVEQLAPPLWVPRRGFDEANRALGLEPFLADVRSVEIRARVRRGEDVARWVGSAVAAYISEQNLFAGH